LYELLDSIELFSTMSDFEHLANPISQAFFTAAQTQAQPQGNNPG
jgi:hypothetical protein